MSELVRDKALMPTKGRFATDDNADPGTAIDMLLNWCTSATDSNMLAIFGDFGAGKSTLLDQLAKILRRNERYDGEQILTVDFENIHSAKVNSLIAAPGATNTDAQSPGLSNSAAILLVDNFDSANLMNGQQTVPPDVRELTPLLKSGVRIIVATRRRSSDKNDELVRQLKSRARSDLLEARHPVMMDILPFEISDLKTYLSEHPSESLTRVQEYLESFSQYASDHLRRPLLLRMMSQIDLEGGRQDFPVTTAELYRRYVESALSRDYDLGRSRLSDVHKTTILAELAFDVFRGAELRVQNRSAFSISYAHIKSTVMEFVQGEPALRLTDEHRSYDWTEDFLATNHILAEQPRPLSSTSQYKTFEFEHPTFYEYFVAMALLERFSRVHLSGYRVRPFPRPPFGLS